MLSPSRRRRRRRRGRIDVYMYAIESSREHTREISSREPYGRGRDKLRDCAAAPRRIIIGPSINNAWLPAEFANARVIACSCTYVYTHTRCSRYVCLYIPARYIRAGAKNAKRCRRARKRERIYVYAREKRVGNSLTVYAALDWLVSGWSKYNRGIIITNRFSVERRTTAWDFSETIEGGRI